MRNVQLLLLGLTLLLLFGCVVPLPAAHAPVTPHAAVVDYGQKIAYTPGQALHFPDFTLTYVGARHETSALFPHGFDFEDFQVERASERYTVSWSSGTGDVGPTFFAVQGKTYRLELVYAAQATWLAANELVIQPARAAS